MSSEVEPLLHHCVKCSAVLDVSEQEPFAEVECPTCHTRMHVRNRFDHFELIEAIASGGMGTVYRARDLNLDRVVALKLLRKEFSEDEEYIEKLETEAKITASVNHPNVVKVFSFGCDQGLYYIAMELVDKGSLDDLMGLQTRIAEIQVLEIGIQVARGLNAALQAGLIHRDVKPGNILFADARTSKIVDFGLAMPLEQARDAEEGEIWGTPYYVAPEKLNHEPEDFRSDIYSLGGTLFHALAGRPPFEADNASMVALKHLKSQVVSLQAFAPDISSPTAYVINRTLAKSPDERYQSYEELIEHLEYARNNLLDNTGRPRQGKTRVVMEGEDQQRLLGYILMAVIGITLILGIIFFVFRDNLRTRGQSLADLERTRLLQAASSAEDSYTIARKMVIDGDAEGALPVLWQLGQRGNVTAPLKGWIVTQTGLAAYLSHLPNLARDSFAALRNEAVGQSGGEHQSVSDFFLNLSMLMTRDGAASPAAVIKDYSVADYRSLALLALALKEWNDGRFANAAELFEAFQAVEPKDQWDWIAGYKPLTQRYLDDYTTASELLTEATKATTKEQKGALYSKVEIVRMNLMMRGALSDHIARIERSLGGARPIEGGPVTGRPGASLPVIRDQAFRMIRDFDPEQARKQVDTASAAGDYMEAFHILSRQVGHVADFKKQLIDDLNAEGYTGPITLRQGNRELTGKVTKATEFRVEVTTPEGKRSLLWADLSGQGILRIAQSFIRTRPGEVPSDNDLKRLWGYGAYAAMISDKKEALPRLMRAAEFKRDYARDLSLFDSMLK